MIIIPLQAIPNQSLSIQLNDNNFDIRIRACGNISAISISANGSLIIQNQRMVPEGPLIGYKYLENGNFYMLTENDEYPDYNFFGVTQYLIYALPSELEAIRDALSN